MTFATLLSFCVTSVPYVFADESASAHFHVKNGDMNNFGGLSTSSNFSQVSAGGQTQSGTSSSASFALDSGQLYFDSFSLISQNWQWYDDETNETPTNPLASENVAPSDINNNTMKLRMTVAQIGFIADHDVKFKLQYSTASDFSTGSNDVVEQGSCTGTSKWCYADGVDTDNDIITTKVLSDSDPCASSVGIGCGTHNESGTNVSTFTQVASSSAEYEFTVRDSGAAPNTVYFFRLFDLGSNLSIPLNPNTAATYPSLATGGTTLDFSINGLATTTSTGGVVTDFTTTATDVPFGTLPVGATVNGAHRLTVSTNATQGYEIFTYQRQAFLGSVGEEIPPIPGTNASPVSWISDCAPSAPGCYGYHTTESVLSGGSPHDTRFAPIDSYAQFSSTTPDEIAYSSGPVSGKSTDIVYRAEVHGGQAADVYSTDIVYIVVPTF